MSKGHENVAARDEFKEKRAEIEKDSLLIPVYEDEAHFQIQATIIAAQVLTGSRPQVKSFAGRGMSVIHWLCNSKNRCLVYGKGWKVHLYNHN